jgi:hypothetical protein
MILLALMTLVMMTGAASALSPLKIDDMRGAIFPEAASRGNGRKNPAAGTQDRVRRRGEERSDDAVQDATGREMDRFQSCSSGLAAMAV